MCFSVPALPPAMTALRPRSSGASLPNALCAPSFHGHSPNSNSAENVLERIEREPVTLFAEVCVVLLSLCGRLFLLRGRRVSRVAGVTAKELFGVCLKGRFGQRRCWLDCKI